jgi:histidinol dehydrogenase
VNAKQISTYVSYIIEDIKETAIKVVFKYLKNLIMQICLKDDAVKRIPKLLKNVIKSSYSNILAYYKYERFQIKKGEIALKTV